MNTNRKVVFFVVVDVYDCVATVFFLDTAHNVIAYIETIYDILKPGGYWVNLGNERKREGEKERKGEAYRDRERKERERERERERDTQMGERARYI